jgi:hypothetical protein
MRQDYLTRRDLLRRSLAGSLGVCSLSGWMPLLAQDAARHPQRRRSCILLWMNGGPSTIDLWDLKPHHDNGGPFRPIATNVPGVQISELLPRLAQRMDKLAILRGMSTREGDHGRATYLMRTGSLPMGSVAYPSLGALVAKELGDENAELPAFVAIAPFRQFNQAAFGPGFLGPRYAPLIVGESVFFGVQPNSPPPDELLRVQNMERPADVRAEQADARLEMLLQMERDFLAERPGLSPSSHLAAYEQANRLMRSRATRVFDLHSEPACVRDCYGQTLFGQGCLLARRLVEQGVPFVEVTLGAMPGAPAGWDTHAQNFDQTRVLAGALDQAFSALLDDLAQRGLLETTTIVWMGEFGRTPRINPQRGRDHYPNAWASVLAGGGIRGGAVVGRTSADGTTVEDRPTPVVDLLATLCRALGIDYTRTNQSNVGRPIRIVDRGAVPVEEVLA